MTTSADSVREEFKSARNAVRTSWSEAEVLAALSRAESIALLALGEKLCPELPPDHIKVAPNERWS